MCFTRVHFLPSKSNSVIKNVLLANLKYEPFGSWVELTLSGLARTAGAQTGRRTVVEFFGVKSPPHFPCNSERSVTETDSGI